MTKKPTLGRKAPSEPIAAVSAPDTGKVVLWNDPAPVPAPGLSAAFRAALGGTGQPNHLASTKAKDRAGIAGDVGLIERDADAVFHVHDPFRCGRATHIWSEPP